MKTLCDIVSDTLLTEKMKAGTEGFSVPWALLWLPDEKMVIRLEFSDSGFYVDGCDASIDYSVFKDISPLDSFSSILEEKEPYDGGQMDYLEEVECFGDDIRNAIPSLFEFLDVSADTAYAIVKADVVQSPILSDRRVAL